MSAHINNLRKFAFAVLVAAMAAACTEDWGFGTSEDQPAGPVLSLTTGSSFETRSDGHDNIKDEDEYAEAGEEVIRRVDLFFFDGKDDKNAPFHACEVTVDAKTKADLTVKVPQNLAEKFTNATYVYALVNLPATVKVDATAKTIDGKSATLENLQQVWVTEEGFVKAGTPATFVMRGGNVENIEVSKGSDGALHVSGTILLERLASKIRLWADIPDEIYLDENGKTVEKKEDAAEVWEKTSDNVNFYLYNLTTKGRIDGYLGSEGDTDPVDLGYDNVDRSKANAVRHLVTDASLKAADKDARYTYSHVPAYYSYPNKWEDGTLSKDNQTYAIVSVTWRKANEGKDGYEIQHCYYQLPVNALKAGNIDANQLAPNHYYRIKVHIGMLGSKDLGDPTPLDASYEVVDWVTNDVDVTIKDRRYLVVNQKEWVMNNVSTLEIPFHTSHRTIVEACYVNFFRYNDVWGTEQESRSVVYNTTGYYQDIQGAPQYNKDEFSVWKNAGGDTEQLLEDISFDGTDGNELYYKPKYFTGDFYVGREHPITFKRNKVKCPESLSDAEKAAWNLYNEKYDNINAVYTCTIDPEKNVINFNHPLIAWEKKQKDGEEYYVPIINTRTDGLWDEYSRCEIIIKIKHEDWKKDDHLFEETIYITQYPGMYVEESHNYGNIANTYEIRNIFGNVTRKKYYGGNEYVRVNGETTYNENDAINSNQDYEIGIYGAFGVTNSLIQYDARTNMNPNMYVIHITQLSADDKEHQYEIGDPRSLTSNINLSDNSFNSSPPTDNPAVGWPRTNLYYTAMYPNAVSKALYGGPNNNPNGSDKWNNGQPQGKGTLTYYYPTDETNGAGSKENFVAPIIRIASSFGKIQSLVKSEARRRCAAYQEAGRPAGRWRLPTKGEVKYIAALSRDGIIPVLFGPTGSASYAYYWTATGVVGVDRQAEISEQNVPNNTPNIGTSVISVRCVYDDWYWVKDDGTEDVVTPEISNTDGKPADEYWGRVSDFYWGDKKKDNTQAQSIIRRLTKSK